MEAASGKPLFAINDENCCFTWAKAGPARLLHRLASFIICAEPEPAARFFRFFRTCARVWVFDSTVSMTFAETFAPDPDRSRPVVVGILLAAGRGRRFDPTGRRNKLMQLLPDQTPVALQSLRTLRQAVDTVVAVVAPGALKVQALLQNEGVPVVVCETADSGMAESLKAALQASLALGPGSATAAGAHAAPATRHSLAGWVVALADMPFVQADTPRALAAAVRGGARVAVPVFNGKRGNPVAFSRFCLPDLMALSGDAGARGLLGAPDVLRIPVSDPGVLRDIDTPGDLDPS